MTTSVRRVPDVDVYVCIILLDSGVSVEFLSGQGVPVYVGTRFHSVVAFIGRGGGFNRVAAGGARYFRPFCRLRGGMFRGLFYLSFSVDLLRFS